VVAAQRGGDRILIEVRVGTALRLAPQVFVLRRLRVRRRLAIEPAAADAVLLDLGGFDLDARIVGGLRRASRAGRLRRGEEALRVQGQQLRHRAGAEREADDVGALELEMIEQARHVERLLPPIGLGVARLAALAGAAGVEGDDAEILLQVADHAGGDPALQGGGASVQQYDRLALAAVDVVDLHAVKIGVLAVVDREGRRG
jgi:hypothetical protein